jgi:hypothetical protein
MRGLVAVILQREGFCSGAWRRSALPWHNGIRTASWQRAALRLRAPRDQGSAVVAQFACEIALFADCLDGRAGEPRRSDRNQLPTT